MSNKDASSAEENTAKALFIKECKEGGALLLLFTIALAVTSVICMSSSIQSFWQLLPSSIYAIGKIAMVMMPIIILIKFAVIYNLHALNITMAGVEWLLEKVGIKNNPTTL